MPILIAKAPMAFAGVQTQSRPDADPVSPTDVTRIVSGERQEATSPDRSVRVTTSEDGQVRAARIHVSAPEGFEDLEGPVETLFDVYYLGERVGLFEGRLDDGTFTFANPEELALKLPDVDTVVTEAFLDQMLDANEELRCPPGMTEGCGTLSVGQSGVIVDPDRFRVNLFLGRDYLTSVPPREILLGNPVSGPSLVQNIAASLSTSSNSSDDARFGANLNTYASVGKTSLVSNLNLDDTSGARWQEAYVQSYFSDYRVAAGLVRDDGARTIESTSFYGAELSSFDRRERTADDRSGTPLDVVLPVSARVEIYRAGSLVSARQYGAGLQVLDTSSLPLGSYPVRIVARDSTGIILDETRSYSKTPDLPPAGQTNFSVKAGVRASERLSLQDGDTRSDDPFPESTGEAFLSASATRRLTDSMSARVGVVAVDGDLYPEAEVQLYNGQLRATTAVAFGPDAQYSALANVNLRTGNVSSSLSLRKTEAAPLAPGEIFDSNEFRPFFQSETSAYGSISTPAFGGSLSVRGSYSESDFADTRSTVGVNFTRPFRDNGFGTGLIGFDAVTGDDETRVGVRLTFRRSAGPKSSFTGAAGADYTRYDYPDSAEERVDPLLRVGYTRSGQVGGTLLDGQIEAGTANGQADVTLAGTAASRRGTLDVSAGVTRPRDRDTTDVFLASNVQTGFVMGGGKVQFGTRGYGDAAILVEVPDTEYSGGASGRFDVNVNSQSNTSVKVGESASILVPSLSSATVGLLPDGAPPFEIDYSPRKVPLYPGNVVRMTWEATYVVTAIGRLTDERGNGLANAVVQTSSDLAVTTKNGYFSISGDVNDEVRVRTRSAIDCGVVATLQSEGPKQDYIKLGDIVCDTAPSMQVASMAAPDLAVGSVPGKQEDDLSAPGTLYAQAREERGAGFDSGAILAGWTVGQPLLLEAEPVRWTTAYDPERQIYVGGTGQIPSTPDGDMRHISFGSPNSAVAAARSLPDYLQSTFASAGQALVSLILPADPPEQEAEPVATLRAIRNRDAELVRGRVTEEVHSVAASEAKERGQRDAPWQADPELSWSATLPSGPASGGDTDHWTCLPAPYKSGFTTIAGDDRHTVIGRLSRIGLAIQKSVYEQFQLVGADGERIPLVTDADGRFCIPGLQKGRAYRVEISPSEYITVRVPDEDGNVHHVDEFWSYTW